MILLLLLISLKTFASAPLHWSYILEITDRHEFYQNSEVIVKPKNSWQGLFGLVYLDRRLNRLKDCVYFRVPGDETGVLKIKTIPAVDSCEGFLLKDGDKTVQDIKTLQFLLKDSLLKIDMSLKDFRSDNWEASIQSSFERPEAKMNISSSEFKGAKIIFLAPVTSSALTNDEFFATNFLCHNINEDCQEVTPPQCHRCENGWYEIPTGCEQGPKYCGIHNCGSKGKPACRRGIKWQKRTEDFDCRTNSDFAYCSEGLVVVCDGKKAICR